MVSFVSYLAPWTYGRPADPNDQFCTSSERFGPNAAQMLRMGSFDIILDHFGARLSRRMGSFDIILGSPWGKTAQMLKIIRLGHIFGSCLEETWDLEGQKRVSIEMTSTRYGLPFGMAAEQPPKAPLAHPPRAPEAHKALLPNVPLIPTTAGPLAQQFPRALFPKGTREVRLLLNQMSEPFSQLRFSILAGLRRGATGFSRRVSLKVTRVVVRGRLKKRQRKGCLKKSRFLLQTQPSER